MLHLDSSETGGTPLCVGLLSLSHLRRNEQCVKVSGWRRSSWWVTEAEREDSLRRSSAGWPDNTILMNLDSLLFSSIFCFWAARLTSLYDLLLLFVAKRRRRDSCPGFRMIIAHFLLFLSVSVSCLTAVFFTYLLINQLHSYWATSYTVTRWRSEEWPNSKRETVRGVRAIMKQAVH